MQVCLPVGSVGKRWVGLALLECVRDSIARHHMLDHGETVVVGVSGGPDSLCLLHVLTSLRAEYALHLHVGHLNHCLRGLESDADAAFVAQLAEQWGLDYTVEACDVPALARASKIAIEEAARQARYLFLARTAAKVGARRIAVGHNSDDQVETILMHLLRGSGLAGLRGMAPVSRLSDLRLVMQAATGKGHRLQLIRPLLGVQREEIEAYCRAHDLHPRFDRSNLDTTYYRNRLRHELLPFLESFNPNIREVLLRSAQVVSADHDYIRTHSNRAWSRIVITESGQAIAFNLVGWRKLPLALQRSTMREAIRRLRRSLRNINWVHIDDAVRAVAVGNTGKRATLPQGLEVVLDYDYFTVADQGYVSPAPDLPSMSQIELTLRPPDRVQLPGSNWSLAAHVVSRTEVKDRNLHPTSAWHAYLDYDVAGELLCLRPRRRGDRFWPLGLGDMPSTVNRFMTNAKVPRACRDSIPLLVSKEHVLWIAGWRIDERAKVTERTRRVLVLKFENTPAP